jgi:acetate kinase
VIREPVKEAMRSVAELVPLHNPPSLRAVEICERLLPEVPQVGVFETGFHVTVPPEAYLYGVPYEWCERHGVRKFGFHSCSHRYVTERAAQLLAKRLEDVSLISCHLGSGTSVCAVRNGESVDISSGLTPQSGTIMSTRPGDFDPGLVTYVMGREGLSLEQLMEALVRRGGLLGISGVSGDVRDLERAAEEGNERARLALKVFAYQVRRYIGQFLVLLPELDAVVFAGGIGEKSAGLREAICAGLERFGIVLDPGLNRDLRGEGRISSSDAAVQIWVVQTDEEVVVSREAFRLLQKEAAVVCR